MYVPGTPTVRSMVSGTDMSWVHDGDFLIGRLTIAVPNAAVINATVSYDGVAQHHQWIADPDRTSECAPRGLRNLRPEAGQPQGSDYKCVRTGTRCPTTRARRRMANVASRFRVAHLGGMPRTQDAADLLATTPAGHFAVVECTTGLLKAENKLALLHARATAVRQSLSASNSSHLRVLPIIVTSRTAAEVQADMDSAERLGILVITRETLDSAIERSLILPNAEQTYAQAEQRVTAALAKYQTPDEPSLPLES